MYFRAGGGFKSWLTHDDAQVPRAWQWTPRMPIERVVMATESSHSCIRPSTLGYGRDDLVTLNDAVAFRDPLRIIESQTLPFSACPWPQTSNFGDLATLGRVAQPLHNRRERVKRHARRRLALRVDLPILEFGRYLSRTPTYYDQSNHLGFRRQTEDFPSCVGVEPSDRMGDQILLGGGQQ